MHRIHYRFGLVLGLILGAVAFQLAAPEGDGARLVAVILQAAALVAAVVASRAHRGLILLSAIVATAGVAGSTAALIGSDEFGNTSAALLALLYLVLTPPAIAWGLIKQQREEEHGVTLQTMFGVLCLYLLIGLLFASAFAVIQELSSTDVFTTGNEERDDFLYFSYSTLTTVGYGDLVAATELGRSLAITEALIGQIYLVTVVALIVSNLRPAGRRRA